MNTKIILSSIVHKRYGKIEHFFKYKVPSLFLDLDELEIIKSKSKIFSINSFNIFSFNERDHVVGNHGHSTQVKISSGFVFR